MDTKLQDLKVQRLKCGNVANLSVMTNTNES